MNADSSKRFGVLRDCIATPGDGGAEQLEEYLRKPEYLHVINEQDKDGNTLLHNAALPGKAAYAQVLMNAGTEIDLPNVYGVTPLMTAIDTVAVTERGPAAVVIESLVAAGADIRRADGQGNTALHRAVNKPKTLSLLLAAGGNLHAANLHGDTPLYLMTRQRKKRRYYQCVETVLRLHERDGSDAHALHRAALSDAYQTAAGLIVDGADLSAECAGWTPLHWAVAGQDLQVADALLAAGANPDPTDPGGHTPLYHAVRQGDLDMTRRLLDNGADPDRAVEAIAYQYRRTDLAALRKMFGGWGNIRGYRGEKVGLMTETKRYTRLRDNVSSDTRRGLLQALVDHGLTLDWGDDDGNSLLHLVCDTSASQADMAILVDKQAPLNVYNKAGETPLYKFVANLMLPGKGPLQYLLEAGADVAAAHRDKPGAIKALVREKWGEAGHVMPWDRPHAEAVTSCLYSYLADNPKLDGNVQRR